MKILNAPADRAPRPRVDLLDQDHPLVVLDKIISGLRTEGQDCWLVFQTYEYHPSESGNYEDSYEYFNEAEFTGEEVKTRCNELADFFHNAYEKERDILVWSEVLTRQIGAPNDAPRASVHIPMLDYVCPPQFNEIGRRDDIKNPYTRCGEDFYFNSGKSLHSYGTKCLGREEWVKFMGRALLMNQEFAITDVRWIGHCLTRGYAALRLTCSGWKYKQLPKLVANPWVVAEDPRPVLAEGVVF